MTPQLRAAAAAPFFFPRPAPAGRRITAGLSHIQRIGKGANLQVWFPDELRRRLADIARPARRDFPAAWAAVRQFELEQEGGNISIQDLDVTRLERSLGYMAGKMRGGGYRVTVATVGGYDDDVARDDLRLLDQRLQDRLSRLIQMIYLEEASRARSADFHAALDSGGWNHRDHLPHLGTVLNASRIYCRRNTRLDLAAHFLEALGEIPPQHILHDVALGLRLPKNNSENEWIYIAESDETLKEMNSLLNNLFRGFGKTTAHHLRGSGHRLTAAHDAHYRASARFALH